MTDDKDEFFELGIDDRKLEAEAEEILAGLADLDTEMEKILAGLADLDERLAEIPEPDLSGL